MIIIVIKTEVGFKARLSDSNRPSLTVEFVNLADVYNFANWASDRYGTVVDVKFIR